MYPLGPVCTAVFDNNPVDFWPSNDACLDMHDCTRNSGPLDTFDLVSVIWIHVRDKAVHIFKVRRPHGREFREELITRTGPWCILRRHACIQYQKKLDERWISIIDDN